LHEQWREREHTVPINPNLRLEPEGLVLGAGTVLVPAYAERRLETLEGLEPRLLALLSAAYGKPVAPLDLLSKPESQAWIRAQWLDQSLRQVQGERLAPGALVLFYTHSKGVRREALCWRSEGSGKNRARL
jgi:hypothetical protein